MTLRSQTITSAISTLVFSGILFLTPLGNETPASSPLTLIAELLAFISLVYFVVCSVIFLIHARASSYKSTTLEPTNKKTNVTAIVVIMVVILFIWHFLTLYYMSGVKLALTEQPQDASFNIATGFTGGMGSTPVLGALGDRPLEFNYQPIFFDESKVGEALKLGKMPNCVLGRPTINVKANITLTPRTGINYSIPPDRAGRQPTESYYEAVVNKLYSVSITATPCKN